jgi:hypothetical protein
MATKHLGLPIASLCQMLVLSELETADFASLCARLSTLVKGHSFAVLDQELANYLSIANSEGTHATKKFGTSPTLMNLGIWWWPQQPGSEGEWT